MLKIEFEQFHINLEKQAPYPAGLEMLFDEQALQNSVDCVSVTQWKNVDNALDGFEILSGVLQDTFAMKVSIIHPFPYVISKQRVEELLKCENSKADELAIHRSMLAHQSNTLPPTFELLGKLAKQWKMKQINFPKMNLTEKERSLIQNGSGDHEVQLSDFSSSCG